MYEVIDDDYPNLESYLCYECGFQTNTVLMNEKGLYHEYQKLFVHAKVMLKPKKIPRPTRNQHDFKHEDDSTEPNFMT